MIDGTKQFITNSGTATTRFITVTAVTGERGRGFSDFPRILDEGRVAIAALATGAADGCREAAVAYAHDRSVFGAPLASRQHVQFTIARMRSRVCWA